MRANKIPVMVFHDKNSGEGPEVFRLDKKDQAISFFSHLNNNIERGDNHKIVLEEWNKRQWQDATDAGDFMNGEMSAKREKKYLARLKVRNKK